ncbi:MAG TPA: DUF2249 domain-containing protein [Candidatus Paceibacterota bacterium]|nr:DUF2249 domain-containing protein [Verrucomicrobiota bacterium]HSA11078.1 DUF2249 domain-containing protein [Candidatus Paceibacterota bacterium]
MNQRIVTLDVREDIRSGREPFERIMRAVAGLKGNEQFMLVAPFEPVPLYAVLARQGFSHQSKATPGGDCEVLFTRGGSGPAKPNPGTARSHPRSCTGPPVVEVDARGLEPPQPLVTILEALASLPEGAALRARTDRRPMHLYAHLEERGFVGETEEQADGSFITHVRRR